MMHRRYLLGAVRTQTWTGNTVIKPRVSKYRYVIWVVVKIMVPVWVP